MSNKKIKTVNNDGSIAEIEVSFEIWEFDKNDFWQNDWQERKRAKENSIEEMFEHNKQICRHEMIDTALVCESAESEYFRRYLFQKLYKALEKLPEKQRKRLIFYFFDNLNFSQIAKIENCSKSSAKTLIYRALQNLREILEKFNT
jgi:RNA polymerase sigma factor (sigma-70 family)